MKYRTESLSDLMLKSKSVAEFVPAFKNANTQNNALFGGQQIPGEDDTLRVADVSLYSHISYARAENVKASSTLIAADEIVAEFVNLIPAKGCCRFGSEVSDHLLSNLVYLVEG